MFNDGEYSYKLSVTSQLLKCISDSTNIGIKSEFNSDDEHVYFWNSDGIPSTIHKANNITFYASLADTLDYNIDIYGDKIVVSHHFVCYAGDDIEVDTTEFTDCSDEEFFQISTTSEQNLTFSTQELVMNLIKLSIHCRQN